MLEKAIKLAAIILLILATIYIYNNFFPLYAYITAGITVFVAMNYLTTNNKKKSKYYED